MRMKITKTDRFWVVIDPTNASTLDDICFSCDLHELENLIRGAERAGYRMSDMNMAICTDRYEATVDATERLENRIGAAGAN